jgi:hypothetical protein
MSMLPTTCGCPSAGREGSDRTVNDAQDGWTAVMLAAQKGHTAAVEVLLRLGADPNSVSQKARSLGTSAHLVLVLMRRLLAVGCMDRHAPRGSKRPHSDSGAAPPAGRRSPGRNPGKASACVCVRACVRACACVTHVCLCVRASMMPTACSGGSVGADPGSSGRPHGHG